MSSDSLLSLLDSQGAVRGKGVQSESAILHFGDPAAESAAAFESTVVSPAENRRLLKVTGTDRARFLHNFCTNDVLSLVPGETCEAFFCDVKAHVLAHGWISAADDCHFVDLWSLGETDLLTHLDRYLITEDVQLQYLDGDHCALLVSGPEAASIVASSSAQFEPGRMTATVDDGWIDVAIPLRENPSVVLWVSKAAAAACWKLLVDAGATPVGELTLESLRILSGIPRVGMDVTSAHLAPEANRNAAAINYNKGCYLGQEPIARIDALGHVNRLLSRIAVASTGVIPTGTDVQSENGESLGFMTSSVVVPFQERSVGLAVLPLRKLSNSGQLQVAISGEVLVPAEIL